MESFTILLLKEGSHAPNTSRSTAFGVLQRLFTGSRMFSYILIIIEQLMMKVLHGAFAVPTQWGY